jgi:Major Facilitator Superfamily
MAVRAESSSARQLYLYFGILTFLIFLDTPEILLDIPTSYILKDHLHATASQVSMFRLLTGIPLYIGFAFGLVRDLWNPFGWRDPGYFRIFVPLTVGAYAWMALSHLSYSGLLAGMILAMLSSRFVMSAYQGLIALLAQETLMSGRLSALFNIFNFAPQVAVTFASGYAAEHLSPRQTFSLAIALTLPIGLFGFWKPRSVFNHTYEDPHALGTNFAGDVKRLVKHWAIYPAVLINFLWTFNPGFNTPLQFYLTERLHASDAAYSNYLGIYFAAYLPTMLLYGFLCTKMPARKLLWWSAIIGVPQMAPLAFVHSAHLALVIAVPMGLLGGLASAAFIDLAMRSCPPGLQGTLMMLIQSVMMFSLRGSDVLGSWIYGLSRDHGFLYCVTATTVVYALILPAILLVPKELIATADGEVNPALEAAVIAEIGEAGSAV